MSKDIEFRNAQLSDAERMDALNRRSLPENYPLQEWRVILQQMSKYCFVAVDNMGKIVGYTLCVLVPSITWPDYLNKQTKKAILASIAVSDEHRHKGIGKMLLKKSIESLHQAENISLNVRISNIHAQKLYKQMGFEKVKIVPRYYADGEDAYLMVRYSDSHA
jgi:[ribosomal protein S18]-alanine N-acetyltransferase